MTSRRGRGTGNGRRPALRRVAAGADAASPARRTTRAGSEPPAVVGVGASAGGLSAFERFLGHLPTDSGLAFVLVSHLAPTGKSLMPSLLARCTAMPVCEAAQGLQVEPNHVYIVRPNTVLTIRQGRLRVAPRSRTQTPPLPIDAFFRSLADDCGERAVGIVLSGTGSDGTLGVRAIKAAGGMTMAQDEESAKFGGMPHSAAASGMVDRVVAVEQMASVLLEYLQHRAVNGEAAAAGREAALGRILTLVRARTGHDFQGYKRSTIGRRIERRMGLLRIGTLAEYLTRLRAQPAEVDVLFKDLLIGVTQFFRDPVSFAALQSKVIARLFTNRGADQPIRAWVPGCATGEEAYSIAMLLLEQRQALNSNVPIKIFATDIDDDALATARAGRYPDAIAADIDAARLARFCLHEGRTYRVVPAVRELVVFATHSLIKDPPFSRLDLISCRNVLIYLDASAQRPLLPLLYSGLAEQGVLFLGPSETLGEFAPLFDALDNKAKLFRRQPAAGRAGTPLPRHLALAARAAPAVAAPTAEAEPSLTRLTDRVLLDSYAPACAVIDARLDVVLFRGQTSRFLEPPPGVPDLNILRMARPGLGRPLRAAITQATKRQAQVRTAGVRVRGESGTRTVDLIVRPLAAASSEPGRYLMVIFDERGGASARPDARAAANEPTLTQQLEEELREARDCLQTRVEQLETANEELKSANEELQSMNEEHQSTNEELETTKEELQSTNEEMESVNAELRARIAQLTRANNDIANLLAATHIATIFLDTKLCVTSFTPATTGLFHLIPSDVGRPITDIAPRIEYADLQADVATVLRTLVPCERELTAPGGGWFLMRMRPYRTLDDVIDGVVVSFIDITDRKTAEGVARAARQFAEAVVDAVHEPLVILDAGLQVRAVNPAYYERFASTAADTAERSFFALCGGAWDTPQLRRLLADAPADGEGCVVSVDLPSHGRRRLRFHARRLQLPSDAGAHLLVSIFEEPERV
jgi:two-component system CheB/CheR fusion protein